MRKKRMLNPAASLVLTVATLLAGPPPASAGEPLRIGVTLHPYYSWVANIVGELARVVPVLPEDADPHTYQPRPDDMQALQDLDVIVINGAGHDAFIEPMLQAAGRDSVPRIRPMDGVPLLPAAGAGGDDTATDTSAPTSAHNSHAFLSVTSAAQQIFNIAAELGKLDVEDAPRFQKNARQYVRRLRWMQTRAMAEIGNLDLTDVRIATVHDGYSYLFRDVGLAVAAVIQPRHGVEPSPRQLADTIARLRDARVDLLFTELDFPQKVVDLIREETGVRPFKLSHVSRGPYSADKYEQDMTGNFQAIIAALRYLTESRR
jgi:zinc transport system substrate-binding protein